MTATSEFMNEGPHYCAATGTVDGARMLLRGLQRLVGVSLVFVSAGLWLTPGADLSGDLVMMKLALSTVCLMAGARLVFTAAKPVQPEIEIDTFSHELRLIRPAQTGNRTLLQRCRFSDLSRVERQGNVMQFWDESGCFIADVHIADQKIMHQLVSGLRECGKAI